MVVFHRLPQSFHCRGRTWSWRRQTLGIAPESGANSRKVRKQILMISLSPGRLLSAR